MIKQVHQPIRGASILMYDSFLIPVEIQTARIQNAEARREDIESSPLTGEPETVSGTRYACAD